MDDARHGQEARPPFPSDALHQQFNTRWVGPLNYERVEAKRVEAKRVEAKRVENKRVQNKTGR
jgi:hypothetical protein